MGLFATHSFEHGIHPPESKLTSRLAIEQFPFAPLLCVPLSQHLGKPAVAQVKEGQEVLRGQLVARADGFMSVPLHAPVSGTVQAVANAPSASGALSPAIWLKPFPSSTQEVIEGEPCDSGTATKDEVLSAIQQAGIVGLGGAAFPTHVKLNVPEHKTVDTLLVNGVECEPYLTTDHRVMLEQTADIMQGIRYLLRIAQVERVLIGVEANKEDAALALARAVPGDLPVSVEVLPVKYPQGAEKMLIRALLGREVPSGGLPADAGALCVNVATVAEIGRLLPRGRGIQERVVTVSGPAVIEPGNYRIPIGTPVRFILDTVGVREDLSRVFLGGPMMGQSLSNLDVPITKGTSGVIAFGKTETDFQLARREAPCIRCAHCVDACPLSLNPSELGLVALAGDHARMAAQLHLMDCFECGACSYVCPAHIPLVQRFRVAKAAVRKARTSGGQR